MAHRAPISIAECDRRLLSIHAAYVLAVDNGDDLQADLAYELLDELLELRLVLPQQRAAS